MTAIRAGLFALLLLSPLPFGSVQPWAVLTIEIAAAALGLPALLMVVRDPDLLRGRSRVVAGLFGALLALGLLQLVPLPAGWTRVVAPETARLREMVAPLSAPASSLVPMSLSAPATLDALLRLTAYGLIGLAALISFREERHLRQLAWVLIASASFQGLYGSAEYLSGHQHIFGYEKRYYVDSATGTFINRNHYAGYLAACLPLVLFELHSAISVGAASARLRERILQLMSRRGFLVVVASAAVLLAWAGVLLSYSRAGLAVAVAATAGTMFSLPGRQSLRRWALAAAIPIIVVLLWQDVRLPGERVLEAISDSAAPESRMTTWSVTLAISPPWLVLGAGAGNFSPVFRLHQPSSVQGLWDHAHSDWLEALLEFGAPGLLIAAAMVAILAATASRLGTGARNSWRRAAFGIGASALLLHASVDFPLRIPAMACLLTVAGTVLMSTRLHAGARPDGLALHPRAAHLGP